MHPSNFILIQSFIPRLALGIIAGIAGIITATLGSVLANNLVHKIHKFPGRSPTSKPRKIWIFFFSSATITVVFGALVAVPSPQPSSTDIYALSSTALRISWIHQFGSPDNDGATSVSIDRSGNVYVAGSTNGALPGQSSVAGQDAFIKKYDSSGEEKWTRQFGSFGADKANDMVFDNSNNIYVVGYSNGTAPGESKSEIQSSFVKLFAPSGKELWTQPFGYTGGDDAASSVVVINGNLYMAGSTTNTLMNEVSYEGYAGFVRSIDSSGHEIWSSKFGPVVGSIWFWGETLRCEALSIASDESGNVFVTGYTTGNLPGQTKGGAGYNGFVKKYDISGKEIWTRQFGAAEGLIAYSVKADRLGNVYLTGSVQGALPGQTDQGGKDVFIRKYDSSGNESWTRQLGSSGDEYGFSLALDNSGNVYVVGDTTGTMPGQFSSGGDDTFICKYNSAGDFIWTRQFGTPSNDMAKAISVGVSGEIYIVGTTDGILAGQANAGNRDAFVVKFIQ